MRSGVCNEISLLLFPPEVKRNMGRAFKWKLKVLVSQLEMQGCRRNGKMWVGSIPVNNIYLLTDLRWLSSLSDMWLIMNVREALPFPSTLQETADRHQHGAKARPLLPSQRGPALSAFHFLVTVLPCAIFAGPDWLMGQPPTAVAFKPEQLLLLLAERPELGGGAPRWKRGKLVACGVWRDRPLTVGIGVVLEPVL